MFCCEAWHILVSYVQPVLLGTIRFAKILMRVGSKYQTVNVLLSLSPIVLYQRRLTYLKKRVCSDNVVLQVLARRCFNDVRALCDIYQISVDTLMKRSCTILLVLLIFEHKCIVVYRRLSVYCVPCMFLMLLYAK